MNASGKLTATIWVLLGVLSILWGASFAFYKVLDDAHVPPLTIVFTRVFLGAIILVAYALATGRRFPRGMWIAFGVMGLLNNVVPFTLIVLGETRIASGLASIINSTTPIFTILVAHLFTRDERMRANAVAGSVVALLGVIVLAGPQVLHGLGGSVPAELACLTAAFVYGCAAVYGRRFRRLGIDPVVGAAGQLCGSTAISLPLMLIVDRPWTFPAPDPGTVAALAGLALFSTAVGYVVYFKILADAGATNAAIVTFLVPVSALVFGAAFLHERLTATEIGGAALIFAGLALVDGRVLQLIPAPLRANG